MLFFCLPCKIKRRFDVLLSGLPSADYTICCRGTPRFPCFIRNASFVKLVFYISKSFRIFFRLPCLIKEDLICYHKYLQDYCQWIAEFPGEPGTAFEGIEGIFERKIPLLETNILPTFLTHFLLFILPSMLDPNIV